MLVATFFEADAKLLPLDTHIRLLDKGLFAKSSHIISASK